MPELPNLLQSPSGIQLTGVRKAGVLMVALGTEVSAEVMKYLNQDEVERVTWEIARLKEVDMDVMQAVVEEFKDRVGTEEYMERAGMDFVRKVLEKAVGMDKTREILSRLGSRPNARPFETLRGLEPSQLFQFIAGEHPQTIALVLSHLSAGTAASVLSRLPPEIQADVATRIATMDATIPDVVQQVEEAILERLLSVGATNVTSVGGATALVDILNQVDRATERTILEGLSTANPALADSIKERMFVFEDISGLDNRTVQAVLREVEQEDLRLALKGVGETVRELIYRNISERAAETLKEDVELMGPVRLRDVEAAQKKIVAVIRRLEESGDVVLRREGADEIIE
ncbi:MAG TPA: flagellar motor switch protein FliG [Armatimonadota bacterium]|jgi:flagellar motor switch protein FliG